MTPDQQIVDLPARVTRLGVVLEPNGDANEAEGVLNPAVARDREGKLLVYPRVVGAGNVSRVGLFVGEGDGPVPEFRRRGYALQPAAPYELRYKAGGYGCEDPRVTFVPCLDQYVMCYTAFGPAGPRIAIALSADGYTWERVGMLDFLEAGRPNGDDKDAAFFPEPVLSPAGVESLALYHRPMLTLSAVHGYQASEEMLAMPPESRESIRLAYIPLAPVLADRNQIMCVKESVLVAYPQGDWGLVKLGGGTPPVRIEEGWLSLYHGVDLLPSPDGRRRLRYSAGLLVHDAQRPHIVRYRSPQPIFVPETRQELTGIVNNVVFPTGIDPQPAFGERSYDVYYGMADYRIGCVRMELGESIIEAAA
jgi:predicted GH43/DUF377 family glycosyl hydrolase